MSRLQTFFSFSRTKPRIVVQLFDDTAWVLWSVQERHGSFKIERQETPTLDSLFDNLQDRLSREHQITLQEQKQCRWRLVISGGFYSTSTRLRSKIWSEQLSTAIATALELDLPGNLEDLETAAIPFDERQVFITAVPKLQIAELATLMSTRVLPLEGVWTHTSALVDRLLEIPSALQEGFFWSGHTEQLVLQHHPTSGGMIIRASAAITPQTFQHKEIPTLIHKNFTNLPAETWPAIAALTLEQIDPSESLNLLRSSGNTNENNGGVLRQQQQKRWAVAILFCGIALGCLSLMFHLQSRQYQQRVRQYQAQVLEAWRSVQLGKTPPAMPLKSLTDARNAWNEAAPQLTSQKTSPPMLVHWSSVLQLIPKESSITITAIRHRGTELWLEGSVRNIADIRQLEQQWSTLEMMEAEPLRLTSSGANSVFTAHFIQKRVKP